MAAAQVIGPANPPPTDNRTVLERLDALENRASTYEVLVRDGISACIRRIEDLENRMGLPVEAPPEILSGSLGKAA